jgi:rhodanese-related sulfurtransferase
MNMLAPSTLGKNTGFSRFFALVCCLCGMVAGLGTLGGCTDTLSDRDIEVIPLAEVRQLTSKPQSIALIDPRSSSEFSKGRLPGAVNITLPQVDDQKDSLDPRLAGYKSLIVYGNDPGSAVARAMTKRLMRAGAKNVKLFSGGLAEWSGNGLKIESDPPVSPAPASR